MPEGLFEGHGVTNPGKCHALPISSLGNNIVHILQGRCELMLVNSLIYEKVASYLEECHDPQVKEMAAS